jgi:nitrilase
MRATLVQMNSISDRDRNLERARELMARAVAEERPDLVVLPETFDFAGGSRADKLRAASGIPGGPAYRMAQSFAREHRVVVHAGSMLERLGDEERVSNTTVVFDRDGKEIARYRKIHLFDVTAPDGTTYNESAAIRPGNEIVTYDIEGFRIGCTICYDLRFAELFISLAGTGADLIMVPAAFTLQTGKDHWEVLLRARAIETQVYVLAAAQCGSFAGADGKLRHTYGHSLICDPWGHVVARASDGEGLVSARIDRSQIARVRQLIPMTGHRRLGLAAPLQDAAE